MLESGSSRNPASAWKFAVCPAVGNEIQVAGIGAEPGVKDLFERLMIVSVGPTGVLHYGAAREQECEHDHADADGIDRGLLHACRPKKNMTAAPNAGSSGISQMWSRKSM